MDVVNNLESDLNFSEYQNGNRIYRINVEEKKFNTELIIVDSVEITSLSFVNCIFNKSVRFSNLTVQSKFEFINCTFKDTVIFKNLTLEIKSVFWSSIFNKKVTLDNVRFNKLADFYQTVFEFPLILYKVDFNGVAVFSKATLKKSILFTYTKVNDSLLFVNTKFYEGLDLSLALISGNITYFNSEIFDFPDKIIDENDYDSAVEDKGIIPIENKLDTYRILKKHSKSNDNQILYLSFSKCEIDTYSKILKSKKGNFYDSKLIFILNKISNKHNTSWIQGLGFTVLIALLFFILTYGFSDNICFHLNSSCKLELNKIVQDFFIFLVPTHKIKDLSICDSSNGVVYFFDLLGRIFIGYGIYQTIQAFRKYK